MKRLILLVLSLLALVTLFPTTVLALGVAMGPTTMEITNALRGAEYERSITVFNPSEPETKYTLRTEGQAGSWVSFYDFNTKLAIQDLTISKQSSTTVLVKVKVPSDITNGAYTTTIYAETVPVKGPDGTGVSAILQATSVLTITVTGKQIISGTVYTIETRDTEIGLPLRLKVNFKNTGNVTATPRIDYQILKGTESIAQVSYNKTEVRSESQVDIPVEWATDTEQVGSYTVRVNVLLNGESLATRELAFKLLAPGTLTKQGELTSLTYEGQTALDTVIKIVGVFKNTGQADTHAKLLAEVYFSGSLVDTTESEEKLIPVGQNDTLTSYYKLTQKGTYTIRGHITFDGKQTAVKEISVTAGGKNSNFQLQLWLPAVIVVVVAISTITFVLLRRRGKQSS